MESHDKIKEKVRSAIISNALGVGMSNEHNPHIVGAMWRPFLITKGTYISIIFDNHLGKTEQYTMRGNFTQYRYADNAIEVLTLLIEAHEENPGEPSYEIVANLKGDGKKGAIFDKYISEYPAES